MFYCIVDVASILEVGRPEKRLQEATSVTAQDESY